MIFAGKKVLVFGTGKSGIAAEDLLHKKGASVVLYDGNDKLEKEEILKKLESRDSVVVVLGELPEEMLDSLDLVVLSPGVPTDLPVVLKMKEKEIPVIGEVELAYQVSRGKVLAITGTNGKTTTTSLLGEIMKAYQPEVKVVGNIGTPYTSAALDTTDDTVTVAEISSFQLETIKEFHPAASAITNITEDHLNRHHTMEEYIRVKECITENQTMDDLCVLNYEDEILRPFGEKLMAEKKVQVMYFSSLRALKDGIYYQDGEIRIAKNGETELLTRTDDLKLLGCDGTSCRRADGNCPQSHSGVCRGRAPHRVCLREGRRGILQRFQGNESGCGHQRHPGDEPPDSADRRRLRQAVHLRRVDSGIRWKGTFPGFDRRYEREDRKSGKKRRIQRHYHGRQLKRSRTDLPRQGKCRGCGSSFPGLRKLGSV